MNERESYLALSTFLPFGPIHLTHLITCLGTASDVWNVSETQLRELELKETLVREFVVHRETFNLATYKDRLDTLGITWITKHDTAYPSNLRELNTAPHTLYCKGTLRRSDVDAVAIVGTRKMTSYGRTVTEQYSSYLSAMGVTIVSGLALGIDGIAHTSALESDGRCIAVLASGLDTISPVTNKWIADKIVNENKGALLSEYPLDTPPAKSHFPNRNRIISGLSKAILVVEGRIKSGTLHTAKHAADQGRTVFAIPGEVTSPNSEVSHYLIRNGAVLADKPETIVEELDLQLQIDRDAVDEILPEDEIEKTILELLRHESLHTDEIVRRSGYSAGEISTKITVMELKGLIKNCGNNTYTI